MIARAMKRFVLFGILGLLFLSTETCAFTTKPAMKMMMNHHQRTATYSAAASLVRRNMAAGGPAVLDKPKTIEKIDEKVDEKDEQLGSDGWEIRLFNDPFNKREFVARCLTTICGKSDSESYQIMMQAHKNGMGVVGRYMLEIAELYYKSLMENGLMVDMVRVDDD
jgi:ATP-dependent Clp protease adapter protein ClpS